MDRSTHREGTQKGSRSGRAAAYVRMSTEHQQYSTDNQLDVIRKYADSRDLEIVRVYADEGKSGLRLDGRDSFKQLISDVESGHANFAVVLVYDVSRWGRFQDTDVGASCEVRCKQAGVKILFCAEQFENDGSPISNIIKSVKRSMAGEYSRELSVKVHAGQCRHIREGHRQGGPAGFGLRRMRVDHTGTHQEELARGDQKALQTDRVILVPGPDDEVATVREIYRLFVEEGRTESEIAAMLNERGVMTDRGTAWTRGTVHQILINEKYIGHNVWNRMSFKLKQERIHNPPAAWVRKEGAFEPIVEKLLFDAAQQMILARSYRMSDTEMLEVLRRVLWRHGYLSGMVIDEAQGCPSSSAYMSRFGSLLRTYSLIGYSPARDYSYVEINRHLRKLHPGVIEGTERAIRDVGATVERGDAPGLLFVNSEFFVSVVLSRCRKTEWGGNRWIIRFDNALRPDITIAVRMDADARTIRDYYLLPAIDFHSDLVRIGEHNDFGLDGYRYDDLSMLYRIARRVPLIKGVGYE